ncbi:MAG: response regulator transcription factor, partial [Methylohalobius sp.]
LTRREFEVFQLLAQGKSVAEIAKVLNISPKTAGVHQTRILRKLHLPNTACLVRLAFSAGLQPQ